VAEEHVHRSAALDNGSDASASATRKSGDVGTGALREAGGRGPLPGATRAGLLARTRGTPALFDLQRAVGNRATAAFAGAAPVAAGATAVQRGVDEGAMGPQYPQAGQAPLDVKDVYAFRYAYRELAPAAIRDVKKAVLTEALPAAVTAAKADPTWPCNPSDPQAQAVLTSFKNGIDAAPHDNSWPAYLAAWNDASLKTLPNHETLVRVLWPLLQKGFIPKVRSQYKRLDLEIDKRVQGLTADAGKIPTGADKAKFSAALKSMPGIKEIIADIKANAAKGQQGVSSIPSVIGTKETAWKDGGKIADKIDKVPATATESDVADTPAALDDMKKKAQKADDFYRRLVEREVLAKIPTPTIKYHLVESVDRAGGNVHNGKSAYTANQDGPNINVGQGVFHWILVHEIGHYIEDSLPREDWLGIELLLGQRHAQAGGGNVVAGFGGGRLKGDYPATGDYTSRTYATATEVSSMTLENLSQGNRLDALIDQDPTQFAVVIRSLRPKSYAGHAPLRAFDKYLP